MQKIQTYERQLTDKDDYELKLKEMEAQMV